MSENGQNGQNGTGLSQSQTALNLINNSTRCQAASALKLENSKNGLDISTSTPNPLPQLPQNTNNQINIATINTNTDLQNFQNTQKITDLQNIIAEKDREIQKLRAKLHVQIEHSRSNGVPKLDKELFKNRVEAFIDREEEFNCF